MFEKVRYLWGGQGARRVRRNRAKIWRSPYLTYCIVAELSLQKPIGWLQNVRRRHCDLLGRIIPSRE
jgi:hypothetical protein